MITRGSIEESILKRQTIKGALSAVIPENTIGPLAVGSSKKRKFVKSIECVEEVDGNSLFPDGKSEKSDITKHTFEHGEKGKEDGLSGDILEASDDDAHTGVIQSTSTSQTIPLLVADEDEEQIDPLLSSAVSAVTSPSVSVLEELVLPRGKSFLLEQ
jgi:hypothetical protein